MINTSAFRLAVCQAKLEMHEGAMEKLKEEAAMKAAEKVGGNAIIFWIKCSL